MLVFVTRDQMRPVSSIFSTIRSRMVVGMTAPMSEGNVVSSARNSKMSDLTPRVTYSMNARRYSMLSSLSTERFCCALAARPAVDSITRTSGAVPASMLAATSRRRRSSFSSSARPFSSSSSASRSAFSSVSNSWRISAFRASISCRRLRRFMFSHSLQIGLNDQLAAPLLGRLRGLALGLRLRHEVAPRADIGILVRRGVHRRDVPDAPKPKNPAGSRVAVILVLIDCKGKGHLVDVTATDQFIQIPPRCRVGQLRPHQQPLLIGDQLQCLVSGAGHDHDVVGMVVLERHVPKVGALQCSAGDHLVVLDTIDFKQNGRALVDDGPALDNHLVSIARRLDGPQLGHADFPLGPNRRPLIP